MRTLSPTVANAAAVASPECGRVSWIVKLYVGPVATITSSSVRPPRFASESASHAAMTNPRANSPVDATNTVRERITGSYRRVSLWCENRVRARSTARGLRIGAHAHAALGLLPLFPVDRARFRGRGRRAVRDPDGRFALGPGSALPRVGARGALRRERCGGDLRLEAGVRDGRAVPARATAELGSSALGVDP